MLRLCRSVPPAAATIAPYAPRWRGRCQCLPTYLLVHLDSPVARLATSLKPFIDAPELTNGRVINTCTPRPKNTQGRFLFRRRARDERLQPIEHRRELIASYEPRIAVL